MFKLLVFAIVVSVITTGTCAVLLYIELSELNTYKPRKTTISSTFLPEKGFMDNWTLTSLHEGSLKITLT